MYVRSNRKIDRGHYLVPHLHNRYLCSRVMQVFSHLQSDKSRAHDNGALYLVRGNIAFDAVGVINVAQRKNTFGVDTLQRRSHGRSSRRQ